MTGQTATQDWRHRARCRDEDPELFFPIGTSGPSLIQIEEAKAVCGRCPVRKACLDWAMETGQDHGIFGGTAEDERRAMQNRKPRRKPAGPRDDKRSWAWDDLHHLMRADVPVREWPDNLGTTPQALVRRLDRHGRRDLARKVERVARQAGAW